jgi:arginyl-tRNA synthetase
VAKYVYDLTHDFARYYAEVPVLKEANIPVLRFRLALVEQVRRTVQECLRLLGIRAPERM